MQGRLQSTPSCLPRGSQAQRMQEKAHIAKNKQKNSDWGGVLVGEAGGFFQSYAGDQQLGIHCLATNLIGRTSLGKSMARW